MTNQRDEHNAHIFYGSHGNQFLDAQGVDVIKYITDFVSLPVDDTTGLPTEFTVTRVSGGSGTTTVAQTDASGGALLITTDNAENDGANLQLNGESFKFGTNKLYFGARLKMSDATQSDLFIGLAETNTDILGNAPVRCGFSKVDGATGLVFEMKATNTTTLEAVHTVVDATYVTLEFYFDGTIMLVYVNGLEIAQVPVTNIPTTELRASLQFLAGAAAAKTCTVDWLRVIQFGRN